MFSGSALEEAETGGRGLLGLLEDGGGGWCMPTRPGESTKGEFSDVKTSETSGETAEPCEFRDRKHPGNTQTSAPVITDRAPIDVRVAFVRLLTNGDPAVTAYTVRTGIFCSTHFFWDKLMDQFIFF